MKLSPDQEKFIERTRLGIERLQEFAGVARGLKLPILATGYLEGAKSLNDQLDLQRRAFRDDSLLNDSK